MSGENIAGEGLSAPQAGATALPPIRARRDFLACARARRFSAGGLTLQARDRLTDDPAAPARVGFTCSRKLGNAVTRNRAKRRLREVARAVLTPQARPGWDYVLIGRPEVTVARPFADLLVDLAVAIERVHRPGAQSAGGGRGSEPKAGGSGRGRGRGVPAPVSRP